MRTSNSNSTYLVLCLSNLLGGATKVLAAAAC